MLSSSVKESVVFVIIFKCVCKHAQKKNYFNKKKKKINFFSTTKNARRNNFIKMQQIQIFYGNHT